MVTKTTDGKGGSKTPAKPTVKVKKPNFFKSCWAELKKVHWPTKKEIVKYTAVVIATCIIMAAVLAIFDLAFSEIFGLLFS